jgi:phytanoyl-CoA dioxygenase PhyH
VTSTVTFGGRTRIGAAAVFGRMPPDPAHIDRFERDGYVVLPDALAATEVCRLRTLTERVRHRVSPTGDGAVHALGFIGREPGFASLVDRPRVLEVVCAVLGWNLHVYHCHLDVHPPANSDAAPIWRWHQDGGRQNLELESDPRPRLSVKVAWFLSDVSRAGRGNLQVIPGSHRRNRLPRPADPAQDGPPPDGAIDVLAAPGTAVIFDRRLWHARSDNRSRTIRRALFLGYTYRWIRARDVYPESAPWFAALSPIQRQLLGAAVTVDGHWLPTDADAPLRTWMRERGFPAESLR